MAATLNADKELIRTSFPIMKWEEDPNDPSRIFVYGRASTPELDTDEQVVESSFSGKALQEWLETAPALRVQHNALRDPAGSGVKVEINRDGDGAHWVKSAVNEPAAVRGVKMGDLRAYSVGIAAPVIERDMTGKARGGIIKGGKIVEVSLVDSPANRSCFFEIAKAASDGTAQFTGKMFGSDLLTKTATVEEADIVTVDLPKDVSVSFSPADLVKLLEHKRLAEKRAADADAVKRDVRPEVGGGVDVDKLPAEDFAGRGRSYPIHTPGDVSDAASSIGRAGPDNYSSNKLKANIIRIARRKGDAFVAELPESWKEELGMKKAADGTEVEKAKKPKGKKPAFPGAHPAFTGQHQPPHDDADLKDGETKPTATKGMKDCPSCGNGYDADAKTRKCEKCGTKLPKANKSATVVGARVDTVGGIDVSHLDPTALKALAEAILKQHKTLAPTAVKGDDVMCLGCGHELDDDDKFCSECGKPNPIFEGKASKPTPGAGVTGEAAADIKPVPAHREPDGPYIEALEHDAGLPTVPDRDVEVKAAMRLKSLGVPTGEGALHDLLCPAYHPQDAAKAHPTAQLAGMDVSTWARKAEDAAYGASFDEARRAAALWQHAVTIKSAAPDVLHELRDEAHKAFRDANPGPGVFPKPTELAATSFRRPYIGAGHAAPSPGQEGPNTAHVPASGINAGQFDRDHLTTGHAADSPSNKSQDIIPAPVPAGAPQRTYYTNAQRDGARSAMTAMHDHIAATFPDLCPMSGPGVGGEPPVGQRPVPTPAGASKAATVSDAGHAPADGGQEAWAKKARKLQKQLNEARSLAGLEPLAVAKTATVAPAAPAVMDPEVIKAAVIEATAPLAEKLASTEQTLREQREMLDALGNLPDPGTAPFRGLAAGAPITKSSAPPVGTPSAAAVAERTQLAVMRAMQDQARTSPDPAQREAAWAQLYKMSGLTPQ